MSVQATESVGTTATFGAGNGPTAPTGPITTTSKSSDKDMFLQLLVAQMKYQDPMNPTDSGQFLAQSAQFTSLEKMQTVADEVAALATTQMAFGASTLVGRHVSWTAPDGAARTGSVSQVHFRADGPVLEVDGTEVPLGSVTSVTQPSSTGATSGSTGSTPPV